jgi:hypothetical protein
MKISEVKDFYRTATKEQIGRLVESNNKSGIKNEILTEIIHTANHDEVWTTYTPDDFIKFLDESRKVFEDNQKKKG